jgi:GAF domain
VSPAEAAIAAAQAAETPEDVVNHSMRVLFDRLGNRHAHLIPGALDPGQHQFFVAGGFFVTPDRRHQMLVGNIGFPPDQRRLLIPIDGGHPGRVIATARPLLLRDTRMHQEFRQYLRTARMGSAIYAPLLADGAAFGLLIMAAQAGGTFAEEDLQQLIEAAGPAAARWQTLDGQTWLAGAYAAALTAPPSTG